MHGTARRYLPSIQKQGLLAGGDRGSGFRKHIHLVGCVSSTGRTAGIRDGSDTIVKVDLLRLHRDGCRIYMSENRVFLTEGLTGRTTIDTSSSADRAPRIWRASTQIVKAKAMLST